MSLVTPWSVALAAVAGFYLAVGIRRLAMRPRPVVPGPATPELRDEPPAVVNLLTHQLKAPFAASATLLDLAARRVVEVIEVAPDAEHTMVRPRGPMPSDASPYEQRVLTRLRRVGGSEAVPVAQLTQRYAEGGERWHRGLLREVARDARRLGLTRSRSVGLDVTGGIAAGIVATALTVGILRSITLDQDNSGPGLLVAVLVFWGFATLFGYLILVLPIAMLWSDPDRLTAHGREVAAHWLGVRAWLRAHEPLRDLPPAAVAVWDRYLAYGAALGVMPHAVGILDLETSGQRDVVWSDHTGTARPLRVRYLKRNRLLRPLGRVAARARLVWGIFSLVVWATVAALTSAWSPPLRWLPTLIFVVALIQVLRALYRTARSIMDIVWPAEVTGTLVDIHVAGETTVPDDHPGLPATLPTHYHLVVDDGSTDELRPWIVNRDIARGRPVARPTDPSQLKAFIEDTIALAFAPGDTVHLKGERWSRYVSVLEHPARQRDPQPFEGHRTL